MMIPMMTAAELQKNVAEQQIYPAAYRAGAFSAAEMTTSKFCENLGRTQLILRLLA